MIRHDDPKHQEMLELAYDSIDPTARLRLIEKIDALSEDERPRWHELIREIDEMRSMIAAAPISEDLQARLRDIPNHDHASEGGSKHQIRQMWTKTPLGRTAVAACLAVGLALVGYLNWPSNDSDTTIPQLSSSLARQVATTAVAFDVQSSQLEFNTSDPKVLLAALKERQLPFPPAVLDGGPDVKLAGGSVVTFRGEPAVLTVWHRDAQKYLLVQFDPKPLSLPRSYLTSRIKQDENDVMIWPGAGGVCGWALVSNDPIEANPFYGSY